MRTTIVLITLGLGFRLVGFAQENFVEIPGLSLTGANVMQDKMGSPAETLIVTIKPEDVVQESIELQRDTFVEDMEKIGYGIDLSHYPTNAFRVKWRYTKEAAKQTSAFHEKHEGQSVRTAIGAFSRTHTSFPKTQMVKIYFAESRSSWFANPVAGFAGLTEEQAKQMVADLKSK